MSDERSTMLLYYRLNYELPMTLAVARYTMWSTDGSRVLEVSEQRYLDCHEDVERLQDEVMAALHLGIDTLVMSAELPELFPRILAVIAE